MASKRYTQSHCKSALQGDFNLVTISEKGDRSRSDRGESSHPPISSLPVAATINSQGTTENIQMHCTSALQGNFNDVIISSQSGTGGGSSSASTRDRKLSGHGQHSESNGTPSVNNVTGEGHSRTSRATSSPSVGDPVPSGQGQSSQPDIAALPTQAVRVYPARSMGGSGGNRPSQNRVSGDPSRTVNSSASFRDPELSGPSQHSESNRASRVKYPTHRREGHDTVTSAWGGDSISSGQGQSSQSAHANVANPPHSDGYATVPHAESNDPQHDPMDID